MKLHQNQLDLIRHLVRFQMLDYQSCLGFLDIEKTGDRTAMSYAFRPLTKYGYLIKHKDGTVLTTAKGRQLFPEENPLISAGGGASERLRIKQVSHVAMLMERNGIPCFDSLQEEEDTYFIPSACWRRIASGILSTTRFAGMLIAGKKHLAVYDIGDGHMEWQARAEGSLFYLRFHEPKSYTSGMIMICNSEERNEIATNIIRQTMWSRRQLLSDSYAERKRPIRWSSAPIKLKAQYQHVYLMTPDDIQESLSQIKIEEWQIEWQRGDLPVLHDHAQGDYEDWPRRYIANPASDLLKFVYFFAAVKEHHKYQKPNDPNRICYTVCIQKKDLPIFRMYPDVTEAEEVQYGVYQYR